MKKTLIICFACFQTGILYSQSQGEQVADKNPLVSLIMMAFIFFIFFIIFKLIKAIINYLSRH